MISVIVPVYNEERYLSRCVDSILNQTYQDIEIILVDDGSQDGSAILCDEYEKKFANVRVIHKENGGLSSARNAGIEISKGSLLGFVDSDDWIQPETFQYLYDLHIKFDSDVTQIEYTLVKEGENEIKSNKEVVECISGRENILKRYLADGMKEIKSYPVWTKLYKKELFAGIRFPINQLYEDVVTNYDILSKCNTYVISNRVCYYYFSKPVSITRSTFQRKDLDYIKVGKEIYERTYDNTALVKLGDMTWGRTYFMCLCKMIKYGVENGFNVETFLNDALPVMRKNFFSLLKSRMKLNRKIALLFLCTNKRMIYKCIHRK